MSTFIEKQDEKRKNKEAADLYQSGLQHYKSKEWQSAVDCYTQAITIRPDVARYFFARGNCFSKLGELSKSLFDYSMAIRIDPKVASFHDYRGLCYRKLGKMDEALKDYSTAIKLDETNGNFFYNRAMCYTMLHPPDYQNALDNFNLAVTLCDSKYKAYFNRGNCLRKMGKLEESINDLQRAVAIEPSSGAAHNNLGLSLMEMRQFALSLDEFSLAIDLEPKNATFRNNRGLAHFYTKSPDGALQDLAEAIKLNRSESIFYFNRSNVCLGNGKMEQSVVDLDNAIELNSNISAFYHCKGVAYEKLNDYASACEMFDKALGLDPGYLPSLFCLGLLNHSLQKWESATSLFTKVIEVTSKSKPGAKVLFHDPTLHAAAGELTAAVKFDVDYSPVYVHRGKSYLKMKQYEKAVGDFCTALEQGGDKDGNTHNLRAVGLRLMGKFEAAIEDLTIAIGKDESNIEFLFNRSQCYFDTKIYPLATADLTTALRREENDPSLLFHRGIAEYWQKHFPESVADLRLAIDHSLPDKYLADCYYHLGLCYSYLSQPENAVDAFSAAIGLQNENVTFIHERAKALQVCARYDDAISDFNRFSPPFKKNFISYFYRVFHRFFIALSSCGVLSKHFLSPPKSVISKQPKNAHAFFRRGFANKSLKRFEDASDDFATALKIDPANPKLVINFTQIQSVNFIELCPPGHENYSP